MSAITHTGRLEILKLPKLNGSYRPGPAGRIDRCIR
jgi:hypothetical protein